MHLYKDDHIKDVQSTCRGSCNTRMWCADGWVPLQPQGHFDILHLYTMRQNKGLLFSPSSLLHSSNGTRQTCPTKKSHPWRTKHRKRTNNVKLVVRLGTIWRHHFFLCFLIHRCMLLHVSVLSRRLVLSESFRQIIGIKEAFQSDKGLP